MIQIEQIKYYLSQPVISDPGVDALAILLNSVEIKDIIPQLSEYEVNNLGNFLANTFLTFRLTGATLYNLLDEVRVINAIGPTQIPIVEDRRDTMVGISYYCSTTVISDNGIDALAVILNTKDLVSILPLMTGDEILVLSSHICNTFLSDRITDSTITVILSNGELGPRVRITNELVYEKLLTRSTTLPNIRALLSSTVISVPGSTELATLLNGDDITVILDLIPEIQKNNLGIILETNSANVSNLLRSTTLDGLLLNPTVTSNLTVQRTTEIVNRSAVLLEVSNILTSELITDPMTSRFVEILKDQGSASITPVLNEQELQGLTGQLDNPAFTGAFNSAESVELLSDTILFDNASNSAVYNLVNNLDSKGFMGLISKVTNLTSKLFGQDLMQFLLKFDVVSSAFGAFLPTADLKKFIENTKLGELFNAAAGQNQVPFESFFVQASNTFNKLSTQVTDDSTQVFDELLSFVEQSASAVKSFVSGDVAGLVDPGFGHRNAVGGTHDTGMFFQYGKTKELSDLPGSESSVSGEKYNALLNTLNNTLRQDWKPKNSEPGNPLIIEAYKLSGRDYKKDGSTGEYIWNTAYVNWVLNKSGLDYLKVMSPSAYAMYGSPVNFGTFKNVRKGDIIVFSSGFGLGMVGFVWNYDKQTNNVSVLAGCLSGTLKISKFLLTRTNPEFYVSHIRRNWTIPADKDVPLFDTSMPTRPGQQVSGPASAGLPTRPGQAASGPAQRIDYSAGGAGAIGGTIV